ncbi:MAG: DUF177 domain-containing protein [Bacteroidales bacterium]|nr:DUF177 domain-containing protein [Bacteroidales bacterium]
MGKFTAYNVPLKSLGAGTHEFEFHLDGQFFANMENADIRKADVVVKLKVTLVHDRYDLQFTMQGTVTTLCDRCLDDLELPIDTSYRILVEYGKDYNDDSDDLLIIPSSDSNLNVAYMIYDTVALAIPMKHVHPLGKCNRQMTSLLRKHRTRANDEDAELESELIEEMDDMESAAPEE